MTRKWSDSDFTSAVQQSHSVAEVLRALGLVPAGGNYHSVRTLVRQLNLDTTHWTGQGHRKGCSTPMVKAVPLSEVMIEHSTYPRGELKVRLIRTGVLKNECSACHMGPEWQGSPLVMVLDHINGVYDDARLENLRLLCPNCDSQQPTFKGRNKKRRPTKVQQRCSACQKLLRGSRLTGLCIRCVRATSPEQRAFHMVVLDDVPILGVRGAAKKHNVSHTTVRRWLRLANVAQLAGGT